LARGLPSQAVTTVVAGVDMEARQRYAPGPRLRRGSWSKQCRSAVIVARILRALLCCLPSTGLTRPDLQYSRGCGIIRTNVAILGMRRSL
jgi:hypothetical protein